MKTPVRHALSATILHIAISCCCHYFSYRRYIIIRFHDAISSHLSLYRVFIFLMPSARLYFASIRSD